MNISYCPKCGKEVKNNDIRCSHCGMRLNTICPECETLNRFGTEKCSNCGKLLIKYCVDCGASNFPDAKTCRKCGGSFEKPTVVKSEPVYVEPIPVAEQLPVEEQLHVEEPVHVEEVQSVKEVEDINTETIETLPVEEEISEEISDVNETEEQESDISESSADEFTEAISDTDDVAEIPDEETAVEIAEQEKNVTEPEFIVDDVISYQEETVTDFSEAQDLLNTLLDVVDKQEKRVIAVCAEEGMGKTTILNALINSLSQKKILGIYSECSELTKIAPFGAIRDSLLRLISLPDFHSDMPSFFSSQSKQLFTSNFPGLSPQEIDDFMNFLYPAAVGDYRDLYNNRTRTYNLLENILKSITLNNQIVLVIDNFNLIDSSSYEFINNLINKNIINEKLKLVVTYQEHKPAKFYFDEKYSGIFETLSILNMNAVQSSRLVQNFVNTDKIPDGVMFVINNNGKGNIFFAEQYLALLFDAGYIVSNQNIMSFNESIQLPFVPNSIEEVIKARLSLISIPELKESLYTASVLGYKFDKNIFAEVMDYSVEQADEVLRKLSELMYITQSGNFEYSFKNMTSWNTIFDEVQTVPNFKPLCKKIYYTMGKYGLSNVTVKATIAKHRDEAESAFQSWKAAADTAAYLGDEYIYTVCSNQWLIASGYSDASEQINDEQLKVLENLGKIYSFEKPDVAVKYLTKPVLYAQKQQNFPKMIELSAYVIKACSVIENHNGIIETIDMILSSNAGLQPLEKAIILSKKIPSLFVLGNCEEAINLANNDLIPVFEEELSKSADKQQFGELFDIWFEVSMYLANVYSLQGDVQSISYIANIEETLKMNNLQNDKYFIRLALGKAFAQVVLGSINDCFATLNSLSSFDFGNNNLYKSRFNIILSLAKIMSGQSESLKEHLFEYAMFSDDNYDIFGKHLFKLIFAKLLFDSEDYVKSIEIFNEELNYFAKEKIVTGALISWLFISCINLRTGSINSAEDMALKALDVAQNPKFSQYHISIYLQKLLAEIYIEKGDIDAAKMYIEKGMLIAKQFGLEYAKTELYKLYIQLLRHILVNTNSDKDDITGKINKLYQMAMASLQKIDFPKLLAEFQKEYNEFIDYCQRNSIDLK